MSKWLARTRKTPAPYGLERPCRLWKGARHERGYPRARVGGRIRALTRVVYEEHVAPVPDHLMVLHYCDRPDCLEVTHLYLGTAKRNAADMHARNRAWGNRAPRSRADCERLLAIARERLARTRQRVRFLEVRLRSLP